MRVLGHIFQSIISIPRALKNTTVSIAHRTAILIFTSTHYLLLRGEKAREIGDISNLIAWLEQENPDKSVQKQIQDTLSRFLRAHFFQELPENSCLLAALKTHRYSLPALWRGVAQNQPLLHQMYGYLKQHNDCLPADSPFKQTAGPSRLSPDDSVPQLNLAETV